NSAHPPSYIVGNGPNAALQFCALLLASHVVVVGFLESAGMGKEPLSSCLPVKSATEIVHEVAAKVVSVVVRRLQGLCGCRRRV
ncbi:hypothetical protein, partial [Comamonas thiooxydans]|uniref:hypothetical protein n=1 Tax=Comamonas thiooxydans TaxID=363952 RepID=UPI001CBB8E77